MKRSDYCGCCTYFYLMPKSFKLICATTPKIALFMYVELQSSPFFFFLSIYKVIIDTIIPLAVKSVIKSSLPCPNISHACKLNYANLNLCRLSRYHERDPLAGKLYVFLLTVMYFVYLLLCYFQPQKVRP